MSGPRLSDYLDHMKRAASDACAFTEGMSKDDFLTDRRTQSAVVMSLLVVGEAATKIMDRHPEFARSHTDVSWRDMRGMRNRIAHGYFDINFDLVWETVRTALPALLGQLATVRGDVDDEDHDDREASM